MQIPAGEDRLEASLKAVRIIVVALTLGLVGFAVIVSSLPAKPDQPEGLAGPLTAIAIGLAAVNMILRAIIPARMVVGVRRRLAVAADASGAAGDLLQSLIASTIVACALLEGAAFLCFIAWFLESSWPALAAGSALTVGVALHFPTRARAERWLRHQMELLDEERP